MHFDNVLRTITAVDTTDLFIEFDPPLDNDLSVAQTVLNWKTAASAIKDFLPKAGSPAKGAAEDGSDAGAGIDLKALDASDFDGDGLVDMTGEPVGGADIRHQMAESRKQALPLPIKIYPLPAACSQDLCIEISPNYPHRSATVTSLKGQEVERIKFLNNSHLWSHDNIGPGIYYFRCGQIVQKIVILR
jgi:hypothetical protein